MVAAMAKGYRYRRTGRVWPRCDRRFETSHDRQQARELEEDHRQILSVLWRASRDRNFPFRIILASRPEQAMRTFFSSAAHTYKEVFLDDKYHPEVDIERFVPASLIKMGRDCRLRQDWFAPDVPRLLAQRASGQFIYATTALRFVRHPSRALLTAQTCIGVASLQGLQAILRLGCTIHRYPRDKSHSDPRCDVAFCH